MSEAAMPFDPKETLDTMLGLLGLPCEIKEVAEDGGRALMIYTADKELIIGRHGQTLDDLQYLLNRLLHQADAKAPRVQVDCEHWRDMQNDALVQRVRQVAEIVRKTGRPISLEPMNSYERRIVHNAFKDDPEVMSWSPQDDARIKRITLKRRPAPKAPPAPGA